VSGAPAIVDLLDLTGRVAIVASGPDGVGAGIAGRPVG